METYLQKVKKGLKKVFRELFLYPDFNQSNLSYDEYWKKMIGTEFDKINSFQKKRAHFVLGFLKEGDSIIDLGCGNGAVIKEIRKFIHLKTYAVDYSEYVLSKLRELDFETIYADLNDKDLFEKIPNGDYLLMLEVLEHLPHSENFLTKALSHSKKGVFFSFPNTGNIIHRARLMMGKFPMQWVAHPGEHLRFWTFADLVWWLKQLGLYEKSQIFIYGGIPLLNKIFPSLFGRSFIVKVKK
jgi:2-polyprenyl-3-methyl-5-hydroxy-6-metoxy-1,4-benzoquinol methylase